MKKLLSILLSAVLVATLLPAYVMADEEAQDSHTRVSMEEYVDALEEIIGEETVNANFIQYFKQPNKCIDSTSITGTRTVMIKEALDDMFGDYAFKIQRQSDGSVSLFLSYGTNDDMELNAVSLVREYSVDLKNKTISDTYTERMTTVNQSVSISDKILSFSILEKGSEPIMVTYFVPQALQEQYTIKNQI